jgi:hypothetical protein
LGVDLVLIVWGPWKVLIGTGSWKSCRIALH